MKKHRLGQKIWVLFAVSLFMTLFSSLQVFAQNKIDFSQLIRDQRTGRAATLTPKQRQSLNSMIWEALIRTSELHKLGCTRPHDASVRERCENLKRMSPKWDESLFAPEQKR